MAEPEGETRRAFLEKGALVATGLWLGGCALFLKKVDPDVVLPATNGEVRIPLESLPWRAGGRNSLILQVAGMDDKVLLFRSGGGEIMALTMTCTDAGCDVAYRAEPEGIACPCHGSTFDIQGGVTQGPAKTPLRRFPVRVEADAVIVVLGW